MDLHHKQEISVGVLVLIGIALFIAGTMWLRGSNFSQEPEVQIEFPDAGTIKRGSAVRVSGVIMGSVEKVDFQDVGQVLVTVELDERIRLKEDARARLVSVGLAGDAAINLDPGKSTTPLPPGKAVRGEVGQGLAELGTELGAEAKQTLEAIQGIASPQLAEDLRTTMTAIQRFMAVYADPRRGPAAELTRTLQTLQQLSSRIDSSIVAADLTQTLRRGDTLANRLATTGDQLTTTTARLDSILQQVNQGRGTMGKLVTDTALYSEFRTAVTSLRQFVDELRRNPGKIPIQVRIF